MKRKPKANKEKTTQKMNNTKKKGKKKKRQHQNLLSSQMENSTYHFEMGLYVFLEEKRLQQGS